MLVPESYSGEYLDFNLHCKDILQFMIEGSNHCEAPSVEQMRVICVDVQMPGHGDVIGNLQGHRKLCISRQNQNHFVPLIRDHSRSRTAAVNNDVDNQNSKSGSSSAARSSNAASAEDPFPRPEPRGTAQGSSHFNYFR